MVEEKGVFIYANPEARQVTADLLRAAGDALAPAEQGKTQQERVKDAVVEKVLEEQ